MPKDPRLADYTCACCHVTSFLDDSKPVRLDDKRLICPQCAKHSLSLSKEEAEELLEILRCDISLTNDHLQSSHGELSRSDRRAWQSRNELVRRFIRQLRRIRD